MKCGECEGKGFIEFEHGLIMVECQVCKGMEAIDDKPKHLIIPESIEGKTITETAGIARELLEAGKATIIDESGDDLRITDGDDLSNPTTGSPDTSKPKRTRKPKAKKKAGRGTS